MEQVRKMETSTAASIVIRGFLTLAVSIFPLAADAAAKTWYATVGAESDDLGSQGWAFLPNELWIHEKDSVTWTFASDEPHTVTFLLAATVRPTIANDAMFLAPSGSSFPGLPPNDVNSGELCRNPANCPPAPGNTYTVKFPTPGNFKLVCLAHLYMNGTIHVLAASALLPHDQAFYDREATHQSDHLLSDIDHDVEDIDHRGDSDRDDSVSHRVIAGIGQVAATGGGFQTAEIVRFFPETITVHVGDTVEWTNPDPMTNHSITFGVDPAKLRQPNPVVTSGVGVNAILDPDGALHATVSLPTDNVHSGALWPLPADRAVNGPNTGLLPTDPPELSQFPLPAVVLNPVPPPTVAADLNQRYRVTFVHPGIFNYHCAYHDNLGMVGQVIVLP